MWQCHNKKYSNSHESIILNDIPLQEKLVLTCCIKAVNYNNKKKEITLSCIRNYYERICDEKKLNSDYFHSIIMNLASRGTLRLKGKKSDGFYCKSIKLNINERQMIEFMKDRMVHSILE